MSLASTIEDLPQEVRPERAASLMLWTIAGGTALLIGWAAIAKVDQTSVASGRVIPSSQLQVVSNLEGGIVEALLVKPGQRVAAGQPLLRLDKTQFNAEFGKTDAGAAALAARIARLEAELRGGAPSFPAGLPSAAIETELSLYRARQSELAGQSNVARAQLDQAGRALAQAEVEAATRAQAEATARREAALIGPLVEKGIEPQMALVRAESEVAQAAGARAAAEQAVRRARGGVSEANAMLRGVVQRFRAGSNDSLTSARGELAGQRQALPALQDRVARTTVVAPIAGIVNRVLVATVGGTVRPGEPLVEIVPVGDGLVVEAQVRPADVAFIHPGQRATVKLTAYDYSIYGSMDGAVERISPDATVDERTGESHYNIRVRTTTPGLVAADGRKLPIGAGMVAEVDLLGEKRSVLSYLLSPINKVRSNAFREK